MAAIPASSPATTQIVSEPPLIIHLPRSIMSKIFAYVDLQAQTRCLQCSWQTRLHLQPVHLTALACTFNEFLANLLRLPEVQATAQLVQELKRLTYAVDPENLTQMAFQTKADFFLPKLHELLYLLACYCPQAVKKLSLSESHFLQALGVAAHFQNMCEYLGQAYTVCRTEKKNAPTLIKTLFEIASKVKIPSLQRNYYQLLEKKNNKFQMSLIHYVIYEIDIILLRHKAKVADFLQDRIAICTERFQILDRSGIDPTDRATKKMQPLRELFGGISPEFCEFLVGFIGEAMTGGDRLLSLAWITAESSLWCPSKADRFARSFLQALERLDECSEKQGAKFLLVMAFIQGYLEKTYLEAIHVTKTISCSTLRDEAYERIALSLAESSMPHLFETAYTLVEEIESISQRLSLLSRLLRYAMPDERFSVLLTQMRETKEMAKVMSDADGDRQWQCTADAYLFDCFSQLASQNFWRSKRLAELIDNPQDKLKTHQLLEEKIRPLPEPQPVTAPSPWQGKLIEIQQKLLARFQVLGSDTPAEIKTQLSEITKLFDLSPASLNDRLCLLELTTIQQIVIPSFKDWPENQAKITNSLNLTIDIIHLMQGFAIQGMGFYSFLQHIIVFTEHFSQAPLLPINHSLAEQEIKLIQAIQTLFPDEITQDKIVGKVSAWMASQSISRALALAMCIDDPSIKAATFAHIYAAAKEKDPLLLTKIVTKIESDPEDKDVIFAQLAIDFFKDSSGYFLADAFTIILKIGNDFERSDVITYFIQHAQKQGKHNEQIVNWVESYLFETLHAQPDQVWAELAQASALVSDQLKAMCVAKIKDINLQAVINLADDAEPPVKRIRITDTDEPILQLRALQGGK